MLNCIVWNRTVYMYKNGFGNEYLTMVDMPLNQTQPIISGSFKTFIYKSCLQILYTRYMYKENLVLNNLQWLIHHKTKPTTGTFAKYLKKNLDRNNSNMLRAVLNTSWKLDPTKQQLYSHLLPITHNVQVRQKRSAWHCKRMKWHSPMDYNPWLNSGKLQSSALCKYRMLSGRFTKSDGW